MKIKLLFFASCREAAGCKEVEMEVAEGMTVGLLRRKLVEHYPALARMQRVLSVAVDAEYADDAVVLRPGGEVALIPPVSGGS